MNCFSVFKPAIIVLFYLFLSILTLGKQPAIADSELTAFGDSFEITATGPDQDFERPNAFFKNTLAADVAMAEDGTFVATWVYQKKDTSLFDIYHNISTEHIFPFPVYAMRFSADGTPVTPLIKINTDTYTQDRNWNRAAKVACDAEGNFVVAWFRSENNGLGEEYLVARLFYADGFPRSDEFRVSDPISNADWNYFSIAMNHEGTFIITWKGDRPSPLKFRASTTIYAKRYDSEGNPLDTAPIDATPFHTSKRKWIWEPPVVDINNKGQFTIAWTQLNSVGFGIYSTFNVFRMVQRFNADGTMRGTPIKVASPLSSAGGSLDMNVESPSIAIHDNGEFVLTWPVLNGIQDNGSTKAGLYTRFMKHSGFPQGPAISETDHSMWPEGRVDTALDGNGILTIAWHGLEYISYATSETSGILGQKRAIYIRRVTSDGYYVGFPQKVSETISYMGIYKERLSRPAMDTNSNGDTIVIWTMLDENFENAQLLGRYYKLQP